MQLAMEAVGAKEGVIGVKGKKKNAAAAAHDGKPLTHKMLTIAGAVKLPATMSGTVREANDKVMILEK